MIELSEIEIHEVSGGVNLITWANYALEFFTGFVDGINAATGG